jgi:CRP/FNR family transcriptional regulator
LGRSHYPASTVVEEAVRDVVVPAATFHQLMVESEVFRRFVLSNYGDLISDLIVLVDEVAFHSIASRLAGLLVAGSVKTTHQQLADELGSAREVVSRELKEFENQGWVKLGRASIEVLDRAALQRQMRG